MIIFRWAYFQEVFYQIVGLIFGWTNFRVGLLLGVYGKMKFIAFLVQKLRVIDFLQNVLNFTDFQ